MERAKNITTEQKISRFPNGGTVAVNGFIDLVTQRT